MYHLNFCLRQFLAKYEAKMFIKAWKTHFLDVLEPFYSELNKQDCSLNIKVCQFSVSKNCLGVLDHFVGLVLKVFSTIGRDWPKHLNRIISGSFTQTLLDFFFN